MNLKRFFAGMAAALLAAILLSNQQVSAVSASNAIVVDGQTGRVLYEKAPDQQVLIASTTKIMTALLICEQCNVLDRVAIPKEAVGIEGSSMYLREGEVMTVQELLYGLMLHSGNDAAAALAIYCAGTVENFAEMMNDKARLLDMTNSHFVNPHGLDAPGHYSTARDMAKLAAYAMENPIFYQTVSTKAVKAAGRNLQNHNKLLWRVEGADGVKTGFTKASGRILVSSATRQGRRIIVVTMNDPNDWQDHAKLLEDGFSQFEVKELIARNTVLGYVEVAGGQQGQVELLADAGFSLAVTQDEQLQIQLPAPGFVYAPVVQGQNAGYAHVLLDGAAVGKVPIVYGDTVEMTPEEKPRLLDKLRNLFT